MFPWSAPSLIGPQSYTHSPQVTLDFPTLPFLSLWAHQPGLGRQCLCSGKLLPQPFLSQWRWQKPQQALPVLGMTRLLSRTTQSRLRGRWLFLVRSCRCVSKLRHRANQILSDVSSRPIYSPHSATGLLPHAQVFTSLPGSGVSSESTHLFNFSSFVC